MRKHRFREWLKKRITKRIVDKVTGNPKIMGIIFIIVVLVILGFCKLVWGKQACVWGPCDVDPTTMKVKGCDVKYKGIISARRMAEIVKSMNPVYLDCKPLEKKPVKKVKKK